MTEEQKQKRWKRWGRRAGWTLAVILLFGLLLRLSLKTSVVHNWVRKTVVSQANQQLKGELTLDRLSGDLWKEVRIEGVQLVGETPVVRIDSLHAEYNIWALIAGRIDISELGIYHPEINLKQKDGRWNIEDLTVSSEDTATASGMLPIAISAFHIQQGHISVEGDSLPLEQDFAVDQLSLSSSVSYSEEAYSVQLRDLSFLVKNTRLSEPLAIETSASADKNTITLEKLVMATGRSLLESRGAVSPTDSALTFDFSANPIAWRDIAEYSSDFPLSSDLKITVGLSGRPFRFDFSMSASADGLDDFSVNGQFKWQSGLILQHLSSSAKHIDARVFMDDESMPGLEDFKARFDGEVAFDDYRRSQGKLQLSANNIINLPYQLDEITADASLQNQNLAVTLQARHRQQSLNTELTVDRVWAELPKIEGRIRASEINPEYWLQDSTYAGHITLEGRFSGSGWYTQQSPWSYTVSTENARFMKQLIKQFKVSGSIGRDEARLTSKLKVGEGEINLKADARNLIANPAYNFDASMHRFDFASLAGTPNFTTAINGSVSGEGKGTDLESMQLHSAVQIDSSLINGSLLSKLAAEISLQDSVVSVDSASLKSSIAEGGFHLRMNMLQPYTTSNELGLDLQLKDLSALAPLSGANDLQATGNISGKLTPFENENLRFLGTLDVSDIRYDSLFTADRARGSVDLRDGSGDLQYLTDLDLTAPTFSGVDIQNLALITQGTYADSQAVGQFQFSFASANEGRLEQSGDYTLAPGRANIRTSEFNIISDYRTLTLENPFSIHYENDALRMDTMRVSSGDGAYLEMALPIITNNQQLAFVRGRSLNTAVIQSSLLGTSYIKGMLSGQFELVRRDTDLQVDGRMRLYEIEYQDTQFDSLVIDGHIERERMQGTLSLRNEGRELVTGRADLPFKLGDPKEFPATFFEEPVDGQIQVKNVAIERFQKLFSEAGLANTSGMLTLEGVLKGKAGEPEFTADAALRNAKLSGVSVDSVTTGLNYRHSEASLFLDASVMSLKQKAAEINAKIPFLIDMKTFRVNLPEAQDSIAVNVETNNFNLAALNDFVDRRNIREVKGMLDGKVDISGRVDDLKTDGNLALKQGAFRLIPAGIRVDHIQSNLKFDPNKMQLRKFSARSGKGSLTASGEVQLQKLVPGAIDLNMKASNFRAANTSQYNALINMDARAQGKVTSPKITGNLSFISGFIQLQNFGENSVETIQLDSVSNGPEVSVYDSLALDMDISFNRRFFVRNKRYLDLEIELDGGLDLLKEKNNDLQLFGTMTAASGYARPLGKQFDLKEGIVTFTGPPDNPQLNIRTQYEPPQTQEEVIIWYTIEGTVEKPKFKYESQPPMELENILSYTLFGQPFYALDSWKQVVAGSGSNTSATDVALDLLLDRVEALATQKLGIDVVKIDNTSLGGETGTSITTGWYLNPKVFFAIQNIITGSTPDTGFLLEYSLQKNLKLILRQGNGIQQGVDVKWKHDY